MAPMVAGTFAEPEHLMKNPKQIRKEERFFKNEAWPTRFVLLISLASLDVDVAPWSSLRQVARSVASREEGWLLLLVMVGGGTCHQSNISLLKTAPENLSCLINAVDWDKRGA